MERSLNHQGFGTLNALAIEFILGMAINLFVEFPGSANPQAMWEFTIRNPLVLAHLIIGTLIVFGTVTMVIRAFRQHVTAWKVPSVAGLACVLTAWAAGDTFVTLQSDVLSYLMSVAFLLALFCFGWGLYRSRASNVAV